MTVEGLEFEFISNENKNTNQMKPTHQTEHVYFYFQSSLKQMFLQILLRVHFGMISLDVHCVPPY